MGVGDGRRRIIIDQEVNETTILSILKNAWSLHLQNIQEMQYLIDYYKGKQDILQRAEIYSSNINNKTVINYAYSSVRDIVGYTFGKPIQIIPRKFKHKKDIQKITDIMEYENFGTADNEVATLASITGLGYFYLLPTEEVYSDYMPDIPIKNVAGDIFHTFVVQSPKPRKSSYIVL